MIRVAIWTITGAGLVIAVAVAMLALFPRWVLAGELSDRADWFKSLRTPIGGSLCCDVSDGYPVEVEMRGGIWHARIVPGGRYPVPEGWADRWIPVPPEIVLDDVSIDERGYLFIYYDKLRCFVPPLQGF